MTVTGLTVDGHLGPIAMQHDLGPDWRVRFVFGRTEAGALVVARLEISPWRQDVVPGDGVTVAMVRAVNMATVRRYLGTVGREARRPRALRVRRDWQPTTRRDYLNILARHDYLAEAKIPNPAKTLAKELKANRSTVRTWLRRARGL